MPALTDEAFALPLAKKLKRTVVDAGPREKSQTFGSRIFAPYRALGLVSPTDIPFTSVRLGKSTFQVTTSVGRSLQTYDLRKGLNLVFITRPQTPETITATFAWQDKVFAAWGNLQRGHPGGLWVFKRGKRVASLDLPASLDEPIRRLLVFGTWIVGCSDRSIQVWNTGSYQHHTTLRPEQGRDSVGGPIYTGEICNSPTYLNKIFVGKYDGSVDIWNLRTGKLLYSILPASSNAGPVTALQSTPVLSLIAIAHRSGALSIQNVETDQPVLSLRAGSSNTPSVTSISFRSDGMGAGDDGRKPGVMATACVDSGDITLWDLNNGGRMKGILRGAHKISNGETASGINRIEFLDGQPLLVSSGKDNALKTWIFDESPFSPIPRPLHSRSGHSAAVTALEFLPASSNGSESDGKWILSAGKDSSLWGFSSRKDSQNAELSQGKLERKARKAEVAGNGGALARTMDDLKAPEITCIACSLNRDGGMGATAATPIWTNPRVINTDASNATGWESIVTGHRGDRFARTWFWGKKRAGRWTFETGDGTEVKSVTMSQCGAFALVGSAGGSIDMFNLQSGLHQRSFPSPSLGAHGTKVNSRNKGSLPTTLNANGRRHTKAVTGLMVDGLNRIVISCGLDGKVKFWDFMSGRLVDELNWHPMTAVTGLRYSNTSELVAFSCDDLSIRIVDIETKKLVREFWGCVGQVNDLVFSTDGRWVIAASMDSLIRVWDLPTGHLIDVFRVPSTCTALSMSSTGESLATAHADGMQINLWSNRSLFMPVSTRNVDEKTAAAVSAPSISGENAIGPVESAFSREVEQVEVDGPAVATEQLGKDMMTLSAVPRSRWQTLLHLDLVKERNKPKEPPKAPEKAPFFLPSLADHRTTSLPSGTAVTEGDAKLRLSSEGTAVERSRVSKMQRTGNFEDVESRFTDFLQSGCKSGNFETFIDHLKCLTPAKADLEIRSLQPRIREGRSELSIFVTALTDRLVLRKDFELVNAWMAVFLKVHGDTVVKCAEQTTDEYTSLRDALVLWAQTQEQEAKRLGGLPLAIFASSKRPGFLTVRAHRTLYSTSAWNVELTGQKRVGAMLVHQAGSVRVGEIIRYTLTYTPGADPILPTPAELYVTVKNTSAVPLRAAYLHGPYSLYASCYPSTFDPYIKYDRPNTEGIPQFEPYLKAGGSWDAVITVPRHLRRTPQEPSPSELKNGESVTWIIEIISQVVFSNTAVVPFELLVSRDGKSTDLLSGKLASNSLPPPAQLHDHWSPGTKGYQIFASKGVFSTSVALLIDDTASLWNRPSFPLSGERLGAERTATESISANLPSDAGMSASAQPTGRKVHLVVLTHGLHSNLGADMLYLKENIDKAARRADEQKMRDRHSSSKSVHEGDCNDSSGDDEQVIVRGFPGNAARTERGIQYLGKRLAKYVLLMTYPDQPYHPLKNSKPNSPPKPPSTSKETDCTTPCTGRPGCKHHSYRITSISFIGHSLGGLVQTYAIAYIHKYSPRFFEQIRPVNFIALATPFLGLSNENPIYIRFALDLGLVGRTGQDLGLSWTAPKVRSGWGAITGSKRDDHGKPHEHPDPGSKPLLRILPCGAAHEVLHKFQRRTIYSNMVNDGIVPLRTSSLLFLDWKGLERVQKASRDSGLVGTMAEWGWAELTGANSKSLRTACPTTGIALDGNDEVSGVSGGTMFETVGNDNPIEASLSPKPRHTFQYPYQSGIERMAEPRESPSQSSPLGPLSGLLSIFRPKEPKHSSKPKHEKIYKRSQTLRANDFLQDSSSPRSHIPAPSDTFEEEELSAPPKTTFFESAGDLLMPPLPPVDFIIDPASRPRTIFHDRIYHPGDIPPPKPAKRRTLPIGSPQGGSSKAPGWGSAEPQGFNESGLKVEEKIARAYHRDLSWRKVLVRLEPDAHNNIIVRRMFTNAHGWPVIKHLVDTHFGPPSPDDSSGRAVEKANPPGTEVPNPDDEVNDQTMPLGSEPLSRDS